MGSEHTDPPVFSLELATGEDGLVTVLASGELDLAVVDTFAAAIRDAAASGAVRLDLSGLTFMDSTGVRTLNTALREASEGGHALSVSGELHPSVRQILELTGMLALLPIEDRA